MKGSDIQMVIQVLIVLMLFQVKHVIGDFFLQSSYILSNRMFYGHPAGMLHVGYHLIGSAICLLIVGCDFSMIAILLLVEGLIHYHVDWAKDNYIARKSITPKEARFWNLLGFDQLLHHLTYIGMTGYFAYSLDLL
jgi:hypothetical protein